MANNNGKIFHGLELLHCCGGGAFGEVYYCRDISGRFLAVKIISKRKLGDGWQRELKGVANYSRITGEAPELLKIFHVADDAESFYYTMEAADSASESGYVPDTLAGRLEHGPLPQETVFDVLAGIFSGIKTIHDAGFAHRDIKPENIIFVKGIPKLGDIGLISSLSATVTHLAGTMDFIPPEQRTGSVESSRDLRQKSDLYAFGKVIYCAITGNSASDFPSIPDTLENSAVTKYFLRLSFRLCERETVWRIEKLSDLEHELNEIRRKLTFGETRMDEFKYKLHSIWLFWKGAFSLLRLMLKKHPVYAGVFFLFVLTGGYFGFRAFRTGPVFPLPGNKNTQTKTYNFLNGRYTLSVPKTWIFSAKDELIRQRITRLYGKQPPRGEPGNTRYQFRDNIGFFFPRKPAEKINTVVTVARLPVTEAEHAKIPDSGLSAKLRPFLGDIQNLTLRRFNNPRNGYPTVFANGHLPDGSGYMAYLYPAKDHTFLFSIALAEKFAQQDQSAFWQIMDTFERKTNLGEITECASLGTPADLEKLLAKGADVETEDSDGRSLFMIAAGAQNFDTAAFLLTKGADVNATAYNHSSALMIAVDDGQLDGVRFLLKHGADTGLRDDFGNTALVHAVVQKKTEAVQLLVSAGANVNVRLAQTPLLFESAIQPTPEILKILLSSPGLKLNQIDAAGRNVLLSLLYWRLLTRSADNGCAKLLIGQGINVNHADRDGNTALMFAAELGDRELVEYLLRHGAGKNLRNKNGRTAFDYCKDPGLKKILE